MGDILILSKKFFGSGNDHFLLSGTWYNISPNPAFNPITSPDYWGAYGRPAFTFESDGSWTRYQYNRQGEVTKTFRDFRGLPVKPETATDSNSITAIQNQKPNPYGASPSGTGPLAEVVKELDGDSETRIQNKLAGKTTHTYTAVTQDGHQVLRSVTTRFAELNPATALTEIIDTYHKSAPPHLRGKVLRRILPTHEVTTYSYERGFFNTIARSFSPDPLGPFIRSFATQGTVDSPEGVENRTTRQAAIISEDGREHQSALQIYTGSGSYSDASLIDKFYSTEGELVRTERDGRVLSTYARTPGVPGYITTDEQGVKLTTLLDQLGRVTSVAKLSGATTVQTNNGTTTTRTTTTTDGTQVSTTIVDLLGRVISETGINGQTTTYSYPSSGNQKVTGFPGGLVVTESNHPGGEPINRVNSSGSKIIPTHTTITVGTDGRASTQVFQDTSGSPRFFTTVTDWLGRPVSETVPNPAGGTALTTTISYLANGLMGARTFAAATLIMPYRYEYDSLGKLFREGTDLNNNGVLDVASLEPVTETDHRIEYDGWDWMYATETRTYRVDNSNSVSSFTRLNLISAMDMWGNSSRETLIDNSTGFYTETTGYHYPMLAWSGSFTTRSDSYGGDTAQFENGLKTYDSNKSINNYYTYDALSRLKTVVDYNTSSMTHYAHDPVSHQISSVTDHLGQTTSYAYYPPTHANAGMLQTTINALTKQSHKSYNHLGRLVREWGEVDYPTERAYTAYGELNVLKTFRAGTGWSNATWPAGSEGTADLTTWTYTPATGLLANKKDNLNRQISYTYHPNGQVASRVNARSITTTYGGFDGMGLPTTTTYSDGTPSLTIARYRDGSIKSIIDAAGTHIRTYDASGYLDTITTTAGLFDGVQHDYNVGGSGDPESYSVAKSGTTLVSQDFMYDDVHRPSTVTSGSHTATYSYSFMNTTRVAQIDQAYNASNVLSHVREFDSLSRLTASSAYGYSGGSMASTPLASHRTELYDALHRRQTVKSQDDTTWGYSYNDRSELLTGARKLPSAQLLEGQQYTYTYDNLGNITQKQTGGDAAGANLRTQSSPANTLNQYATYQTPSSFDILGQAPLGSTVTVNGVAATFQDTFFRANVPTANSGANGIWQSVSITNAGVTTTGNLYVPPASFTPTYDFDGNLTDDGEWTYLWDAEQRLKTMTRAARAVTAGAPYRCYEHTYDALSRLVQTRTFDTAPATIPVTTEQYLYNGWNRVAMLQSTGSATPILRQSYVWGLDIAAQNGSQSDSGGVAALLLITDHSALITSHYPTYDSNGNVTALVDATSGAITAQ